MRGIQEKEQTKSEVESRTWKAGGKRNGEVDPWQPGGDDQTEPKEMEILIEEVGGKRAWPYDGRKKFKEFYLRVLSTRPIVFGRINILSSIHASPLIHDVINFSSYLAAIRFRTVPHVSFSGKSEQGDKPSFYSIALSRPAPPPVLNGNSMAQGSVSTPRV